MAKLQLTALEGQHQGEVLEAQFNPKEIVLEHGVVWQPQLHQGPADFEFNSVEPVRMSFELLFDGAEAAESVQPQIDKINRLSSVDTILHRPPKVKVAWGNAGGALPTFDAVIESVSVRYVMFAPNGVPLRATVDLRLKQAAHLRVHASRTS